MNSGLYGHPQAELGEIFDSELPTTQAFSDPPDAGTVSVAARRDHKHGMPAETTHTTSENAITDNVGLFTANQWYDGPSLSLAVGTWLLTGTVTVGNDGPAADTIFSAKL